MEKNGKNNFPVVEQMNILREVCYGFRMPNNAITVMKIAAILILSVGITGKIFADIDTVKSVNLYEPPESTSIDFATISNTANQWKPPTCLTCDDVATIQAALNRLGYNAGPVDDQATESLLARLRTQN